MRAHAIFLSLLLVFSLWSLRSIFHPGFMYSHDALWHVERLQNMTALLPVQFPARWSPDLDHDYGVPLFNFTYPAPYYLGAGLMSLGLGPIKTYNLLLFLGYFLGGVGVYLLSHRQRVFGFFAAVLYLLTPYQFLDIFVRGALGEVLALGIIPWVFLSLDQLSSTGRLRWYTSIPFALLILSHNFYGYLFGALLVFLTLILYKHKRQIFISFCLSLGLAAFFLIPAFFEKSFLLFTQTDHFGYRDHFVYPLQLLYSKWSYMGSLPGLDPREMSFQLGLANWGVIILGLAVLLFRLPRLPSRLTWYLALITFSLFMMLPASDWLWATLPLISSIQFPWRFLGLVTALLPLLYLELSQVFIKAKRTKLFTLLSLVLIVLALYNTRNYHLPVKWLSADEFLALHYEYAGGTATAKRSEIVPRWAPVERYSPEDGQSPQVVGDGQLSNISETPLQLSFTGNSPNDRSQVIWYRNYFPTWSATVDGQNLALTPTPTGEVTLPLAPGTHQYQIFFKSTRVELLGNLLSLLSLGYLLYLMRYTK